MPKKAQNNKPLTLQEIILRGEAETIKQALEARVQIDQLLEEREAAYQRIAELETQVSEIVGEDGIFPFPEPPLPVAAFSSKPAKKKAAPKPKPQPAPEPQPKPEPETAKEADTSQAESNQSDRNSDVTESDSETDKA